MNVAFCFSNAVQTLEYYHNSSWLEHGGSPDRAVRLAFVNQINNWLKNKGLYKKNESSITFNDVQDCLILVSSSFSTRTSYENQTKKAITNKFVVCGPGHDGVPQAPAGSLLCGAPGRSRKSLQAGANQ